MLGMRYPIDVAFLGRDGRVMALHPALQPGFRAAACRGAHAALELPVGTLAATGTLPGDRVQWQDAGVEVGRRGSHQEAVS